MNKNSPWNNREAVKEMSVYISMWLCFCIDGETLVPKQAGLLQFFVFPVVIIAEL